MEKACSKCGTVLPATPEYFNRDKRAKDGLVSRCKKCTSDDSKKHYEANKEKRLEQCKAWYEQNKEQKLTTSRAWKERNREKVLDDARQYLRRNREKIREISKKHYEANREKRLQQSREWYKQNKERKFLTRRLWRNNNKEYAANQARQYYLANKERISAVRKVYSKTERGKVLAKARKQKRSILEKQLPSTFTLEQWEVCKQFFNGKCAYCDEESKLTQDHFIPLSKGGEYSKNNIVPVCKSCNVSKGQHSFFEWYPKQAFYSKEREHKILSYLGHKNRISN